MDLEPERIATVYTSLGADPTYDASEVANHIVESANIYPGLIVQLMDAISQAEELLRVKSAASFLAAQAFEQTVKL